MDLHELIKTYGEDDVASELGITTGSLRNKRSGQRPLTIDDLFLLVRRYGYTFDIESTITRIGGKRYSRAKGRDDDGRDDRL